MIYSAPPAGRTALWVEPSSLRAEPPAIVFAGGSADKHTLPTLINLRQSKPLSGNNAPHTHIVAQRSEILEVERKNLYESAIFRSTACKRARSACFVLVMQKLQIQPGFSVEPQMQINRDQFRPMCHFQIYFEPKFRNILEPKTPLSTF